MELVRQEFQFGMALKIYFLSFITTFPVFKIYNYGKYDLEVKKYLRKLGFLT
ncbi:MAG: hypothetical protein ACOC2J_05100 [bacterium]